MAIKKTIKTVWQIRRDTTENWKLNEETTPAAGEPCYDLELHTLKIGDGTTKYKDLPVIGNIEAGDTGSLQAEIEALKNSMEMLQTDVDNVETNVSDIQEQVGDTDVAKVQEDMIKVTENVTNLTTQIETTNTEVVAIQQTLETKADTKVVTELQTIVENKADAAAVEALGTELKSYIDEVVNNVEVGDMDGGVIE